MATGTQISVDEYLHSVYRPDCDYVDGAVEERNLGERDHSLVQAALIVYFESRRTQTGLRAFPEWRFQTGPTRFRVPDIVITRGKPDEQILTSTPVVCIEILSPEDRLSRVNMRVQEYLSVGVPVVWVVDPAEHRVWVYRKNGMEEAVNSVRLDNTEIDIPFSEIFD